MKNHTGHEAGSGSAILFPMTTLNLQKMLWSAASASTHIVRACGSAASRPSTTGPQMLDHKLFAFTW